MSLGGLVTKFGSDTSEFDSGVKRVKSGLGGIASSATSILNPMTAGFVALGAAVIGAGAAVYSFAGRISDLAGIADKAAQTGLSGSFLQQLGYAADQSGVSVETLQGGIKKLTIAIGQVNAETDSGADKFRELGISLSDLQGLSPEQQFLRVAEQIGKIPTTAGRAAASVKIFGKSGIEMTTLFSGGLTDINKLMREAAELGIGIDAEGLAKIAAADDAMQKMKSSFGALLDQVAVGLAPAFTAVSEEVTKLIAPVTLLFAKFNTLDDKFQFTSDLLVAMFDVAIETIKEKFGAMLSGIVTMATDAGKKIIQQLNPVTWAEQLGLFGGGGGGGAPAQSGLSAAQGRLDDVWARLNNAAPGAAPVVGIGGGGAIPPAADKESSKALGKWLSKAVKGAVGLGTDFVKGAVDLAGDIAKGVQDMFGSGSGVATKQGPQFADAMLRGSSAAVSTINAAGRMSPGVKVAQQQLKAQQDGNKHLKQVADNSKPMFAPEFP